MNRILRTATLVVLLLGSGARAPAITTPPDEVPYGVATNWIVGHRLLASGDFAGALPYLHLAYRAQPEEPLIAMDFQFALAAEGFLVDAVNVMDELVSAHPDSSAWRLRRATLNLRLGRPDPALEDLREVRRRGDVELEALELEARIHLQQGRVGSAINVYRNGMELLPEKRAEIYLGMAGLLMDAGEARRVPPLMDEALAVYPEDPGLWLARIHSLTFMGQYDEALAAAEYADREVLPLREAPSAPPGPDGEVQPSTNSYERWPAESFRVELADILARRGEIDRAVTVLESMLPDELNLAPSLWLARLHLGTGRLEEGAAQVERVARRWPEEGRGWFLRGKLSEAEGDWEGAIDFHREATARDPRNPELRVGLVRAMLVAWGDGLAAATDSVSLQRRTVLRNEAMTAAGMVNETDAEGNLVLGYAYRAVGEPDRAIWHFGLAAEDLGLRLTALIQQSICYDEAGQPGRARRVLERLRRDYPEDAEVANSLGYFLAEKGEDLDLADELLTQALAAEPNNGAFLDSLGWLRYRQERYDEAFDRLVRAVNVLPEDPVVLEHLGMVLKALGQTDEARSTLQRALAAGGDAERLREAIAELGDGTGGAGE